MKAPSPAAVRSRSSGESGVRLLIVLGGLSAFGPLTIDVYLPGLPSVAASLDASAAGTQLTLTACVIGIAAGQLLVGPLSDMLGRRRPLLAGLAVFVVASLGCAAAPSVPLLIAARLAQGLSGAAGIVIARAMVRDLHSGVEAGRTFSALNAIVTAGPIFAPLIGSAILLFTDWRGVFVALALIGVALLGAATIATHETLPEWRRQSHAIAAAMRNVGLLVRHRRYLSFALPGALGFGALFSYVAASSLVYQEVFGMTPQLYSVLFAVNGCVLMASNLANRRLIVRFRQESLLVGGLAAVSTAAAAILVAVVAGAGAAIVLPLLLIVPAGTGFVVSNSIALAMEGEPERAGAASALYGVLQFGTAGLVAPLVGVAGASAVPMGVAMATSALAAISSHLFLARKGPG